MRTEALNRFLRSVPFTHDVIIVGRGLAGAVLSETLTHRGLRVLVVDAPIPGRASHVAAGLVNPVSMRRVVPVWRAEELLHQAVDFYVALQEDYGVQLWHPLPLVEIFPNAQVAAAWPRKCADPVTRPFLEDTVPVADIAQLQAAHGAGIVRPCAWLDVRRLLDLHRDRSLRNGVLIERQVEPGDINVRADGVHLFETSAPLMIQCTGPFSHVPGLVPVRGEGLTVHAPDLQLVGAAHRGVFLLPIGDHRYKVGSTFAWTDVWKGATEGGRAWLLEQLARITPKHATVEEHWWGVRPAARDRRPILGRIGPRQAVMNGLGARGVLLAPWSAEHLAAHLFDGTSLDAEVDAARFAGEPAVR